MILDNKLSVNEQVDKMLKKGKHKSGQWFTCDELLAMATRNDYEILGITVKTV